MSQSMFKAIAVDKKKVKKAPKPTEAKQVGKRDQSKTIQKKCRKERRKELKKV